VAGARVRMLRAEARLEPATPGLELRLAIKATIGDRRTWPAVLAQLSSQGFSATTFPFFQT
jgi:hypothetical protein